VTTTTQHVIPVFFATDDGYAPYLSVSLESLIENASAGNLYDVTVLYHDVTEETRQRLQSMATDTVHIRFFPIDQEHLKTVQTDKNKLRFDYVTMTIYYRLFIAEMFPQLDKALYIDADTVITTDIAELYALDLNDNLVAAVHDNFISGHPETSDYVTDALGFPVHDYVNSGVLVMNLRELREQHFASFFSGLLTTYHVQSIAADQDYLNVICHDRILKLGPEWNTMMAEGEALTHDPKIIHYNLFGKPWNYRDAPNADYFWDYAERSPYYSKLVDGLNSFTQDQKLSDAMKREGLIRQAAQIPQNPVTFSKLARNGVRVTL
jgi:lipopolysaccharide biosynthesis glycosyltransferase